jgi:DNA-binding NarL/FixJ family response regulator
MTELVRAARRAKQAQERASQALEQRDALIVELHRQGESPKLIAQAAGISENQVFKIIRAARG